MGHVLVVGSSNTDLVCRAPRIPRVGETIHGSTFHVFAGGKGANQAVAAARAGARVTFVGAVGDDDFGRQRVDELRGEGISVDAVRTVGGAPSGVALITVDDAGENSIVIITGANAQIRADDARNAITASGHDVLSLTLEIPYAVVAASVAASIGRGRTVLNAAPYDPRLAELVNALDVLIVNEIEAGQHLGYDITIANAIDGAQSIVRTGPRAVVITLGKDGAVLATETGAAHFPAPIVHAIDTTGAGDAFCGVFCAWLGAGEPITAATRAGVVAGALAVQVAGAQPSLPSRQAILQAMG
ncbi:MAG: ribokinase [Chloroflexi bacterium]|nr:MAG: ribokinase [Chloroflexota bacterium]